MSSAEQFARYSRYYDLLYRDKDYTGEAAYVARRLRGVQPLARTILELGSGTGRHGRDLAADGFEVFGIDRSEDMVAAARQQSPPPGTGRFDCGVGDARSIELHRTFDAVISLFHVLSYQITNQDLAAMFATARRHVNGNGLFLFDVWHGPAVLHERPATRVRRIQDGPLTLTRIAEPQLDVQAGVVTVDYTLIGSSPDAPAFEFSETHRMRYLFPTEVDLLATHAGFRVLLSEEFLTGASPSEGTWGVAYLLEAC